MKSGRFVCLFRIIHLSGTNLASYIPLVYMLLHGIFNIQCVCVCVGGWVCLGVGGWVGGWLCEGVIHLPPVLQLALLFF